MVITSTADGALGNLNDDLHCYHKATCHAENMIKHTEVFGKFVRLNLIGEIVEVLSFDSTDIVVNYKGKILTMEHYEVTRLTPEEEAVAKRISV
jgi:hypothetical protein